MPPKPWLTKTGPPREDVSAIIQSNPTMKQQIPKISMQSPSLTGPMNADQSLTNNPLGTSTIPGTTGVNGVTGSTFGTGLGTSMNGLGSSYGAGYGSSYGGYGSSYGGYGSSLGGGYGSSMYGSSYGMGGYGSYGMGGMGYGRTGMMGGDPNKPNMVMNTLMTLQSLGFLIGSFCQIGRSLDHNIEGLHLFFNSFKNLFKRMYDTIMRFGSWMGQKGKNLLLGIMNFIKTYVLFMNHKDEKNKMRALKIVTQICVVVLAISFYPQIKKALSKIAHPNAA